MYIVRIWEGLGNQMFQYAFGRSLKYRTGQKVFLDVERSYKDSFEFESKHTERPYALDHFNITLDKIKVEELPEYRFLQQKNQVEKIIFYLSKKQKYFIKFLQDYDSAYHKEYFSSTGSYYAFGWFQQEAYFKDIRKILLKEFTPKKKISLPSDLYSVLKKQNTVAIHIRRGDYIRWGNECNEFYYLRAIEFIKERIENPIFLVFSDDMDWVKKHIEIDGERRYITGEYLFKDYEEMLIMSKCKNQIISNSTFSWWAAWLNQNPDKIVISPSKWFGIQNNIVPNDWLIL